MAVHFDAEVHLATVNFRLAVSINATSTVTETVVVKVEIFAERGKRRLDEVLLTERFRSVIEVTLCTKEVLGR